MLDIFKGTDAGMLSSLKPVGKMSAHREIFPVEGAGAFTSPNATLLYETKDDFCSRNEIFKDPRALPTP